MNAPHQQRAGSARGPVRRVVAALLLSALVFVALWLVAFSVVTSLLISAGCCVVFVAVGAVSDLVEAVLDAIAAVVFGLLAAIEALFAAIFSLFGF